MLLKKLIKNCPSNLKNILVRGLSFDTRSIKRGELFFALPGSINNGENFIQDALKKGACAVITSKKISKQFKSIKVDDVRTCLGEVCSKYFPRKPLNIIAVTGTNGKSSVADFFHQILRYNRIKAATIGTLGVKIKSFKKNKLTSPDVISLHEELSKLKKKNINNVLIEASSHGLEQGRLNGINFKAGIFTNLSQDHLDYHKTFKNYFNSKLILFKNLLNRNSYLITDKEIPEFKKLKKISSKKKLRIKLVNDIEEKEYLNNFNLIGDFQKKNLGMSIIACEILGIDKKRIINSINSIKPVKGRLELARTFNGSRKVFIDFAHTPDALEKAISSLKLYFNKSITVVLGCGGERDKTKRGKIGKIINKLCNKIYITDDNPRNENPANIRKSIIKHINKNKVFNIGNRTEAINAAIKNSTPNEIILIAGKGHEDIQDYGNKKIIISDYEIVRNIKEKKILKRKMNFKINSDLLKGIVKNKIDRNFAGVSINSKTTKKNNLFIAIKGKKNDGHNFIKEAYLKGAAYCVVSKKDKSYIKKKVIKVNDTYSFLKKLSIKKRLNTDAKIVAVTGSSGKTSVKDLVANLLKNFGTTYFSPMSYNNSFGVPLSLCNLEPSHKYGVFEIGMSKAGEINSLSKIVKPHIGIITNVAEAHIENFKSLYHIAKAKGEIINNIVPNGLLIIDKDGKYCNYFKSKAKKKKIKVVTVGYNKNADIKVISSKAFPHYEKFVIKSPKKTYYIKIKGHHIKNILISIAVIENLNLNFEKIIKKIKKLEILKGRGKIIKIRNNNFNFNLIDESYNANPLSMKESIMKLSNMKVKSHKYILLGDMLELGGKTKILHKKLSPIINDSNIDKLFVIGNHIISTYKHVKKSKRGNILQDKSDVKEILFPILQKNDYLMIKGSNATGLQEISKNLSKGRINAI